MPSHDRVHDVGLGASDQAFAFPSASVGSGLQGPWRFFCLKTAVTISGQLCVSTNLYGAIKQVPDLATINRRARRCVVALAYTTLFRRLAHLRVGAMRRPAPRLSKRHDFSGCERQAQRAPHVDQRLDQLRDMRLGVARRRRDAQALGADRDRRIIDRLDVDRRGGAAGDRSPPCSARRRRPSTARYASGSPSPAGRRRSARVWSAAAMYW